MRLFVPANEWYGWKDVELEFPESWDVREMRMAGHDAKALDVKRTPSFFVNGKPLTRFGYEPLRALVGEALSSAQR